MLTRIHADGLTAQDFVSKVKDREGGHKLMGFGHRVYKTYDPRANIMKTTADKLLAKVKGADPLLDIAKRLEDVALNDKYFIDRNLYPNVDFYSGVILRAMGIPVNMFTVIFAMGRMPGWIANWKEVHDLGSALYRPRQVYTGQGEREYMPMKERGTSGCLAPRTTKGGRPVCG
jgi:citrate synthase